MKSSKTEPSNSQKMGASLIRNNLNEMILILNPNAQGGNIGKNWVATYNEVKHFLPRDHRIIFTKKTNDGILITRKLLKKGYKNIAAVGGDGTINEVANGFFNHKLNSQITEFSNLRIDSRFEAINPKSILYVIPFGSRNVLARSLELKHLGVESLIRVRHMKRRKIDTIMATITDKVTPSLTHKRIVMNAAEIGFGAEIIDKSKKVRGKIKNRFVSTMAGIFATLPVYKSNECEVIIDGHKKFSVKMTMAIVSNGRFLGGGFKAAPHAKFSDGLLDIVIMTNSGSFKVVDKLIQLKGSSAYKFEGDILYYQASQVEFLPKERDVTVTVDGEPIGMLPAVFKSYQNALTIKSEPTSIGI